MHRHQVHVAEFVRGGGDVEGEGVLRVHKEDARGPVPGPGQAQEVFRVIGWQLEISDNVEIILKDIVISSLFPSYPSLIPVQI